MSVQTPFGQMPMTPTEYQETYQEAEKAYKDAIKKGRISPFVERKLHVMWSRMNACIAHHVVTGGGSDA